jgi:hypothetical protein
MQNFIIFFEGKEGTSPLVRLLNNFEQISIIHQVNNKGWEPFDRHNCGHMSIRNFKRCLDIVFSKASTDFDRLNRIYIKTAKRPLEKISREGVIGFKMRFTPHRHIKTFSRWHKLSKKVAKYYTKSFRRMMINLLQKNNVIVFLAVRQDILRWGLSKYHGDGTGKSGHLQGKLASGEITRDEIGKIHVDCKRLEKIISKCQKSHSQKRRLMENFKLSGIQAYPLCYEDFLADKQKYFSQIANFLKLRISKEEIDDALKKGGYFKKVHSDNISNFVENHEEVQEKFGDRFIAWY